MKAAILGAGVIGQGWAVRFALMGWEVSVYDQTPGAAEACRSRLAAVNPHVETLYGPLPPRGEILQSADLAETLAGAQWIQESLPEDLVLKQTLYAQIAEVATQTPICSSTSGFKPSDLIANTPSLSSRFLVCHPFNPVYLLPLVEVVPHASVGEKTITWALSALDGIGMRPLRVRKEIDAHIADRLLEAVWREALWLVKDGVATTADIDEAITHSFGLRWAQMGLFETYRLGGGTGGMAHFLEQFGPALQWPWSRLTDVPEMDDRLIAQIVAQSDQQSGKHTADELAEIRDRNLVAIMQAMKTVDWGVGKHLNQHRHST